MNKYFFQNYFLKITYMDHSNVYIPISVQQATEFKKNLKDIGNKDVKHFFVKLNQFKLEIGYFGFARPF